MSDPNYEGAWRALSEPLSWMHKAPALRAYWGWNLAEIANDLIDRAYPGIRIVALASTPSPDVSPDSGERAQIGRWVEEAIERTKRHGNTEGVWLFASQWRVVANALAASPASLSGGAGVTREPLGAYVGITSAANSKYPDAADVSGGSFSFLPINQHIDFADLAPSPEAPANRQEAGEVERRHKAALQDIAEAEAIPNDAVAFVWCREVAREALTSPKDVKGGGR